MMEYDDDDDAPRSDSFDVPTDEEEEDILQYQRYPGSVFPPNVDDAAAEVFLRRPRLTSLSALPPIPTTTMTSPCLPQRARRFTSLPLHLEGSLASTTAAVTVTSFGTPVSEQLPPSPRSLRRAGCSRVWLVLLAYVALITFPHPPILHYNYHVEPSPMVIPVLTSDQEVLTTFRRHKPSQQEKLQEQQQPEQAKQPTEQENASPSQPQQQEQQQPKRKLRQPLLAHARTNRQRQTATVIYGGKPNASLLFLDNMEETPIQKRKVPRFFFSADRNHVNDGTDRSFFHKREAPSHRDRQVPLPWLWWLLNKLAWLVLLAFTLETGVREIPRRFQAWTSLFMSSPNHRSDITVGSDGNRRGTSIHTPPALSRTGSTPRQRRRG